MFGTLIIKVGTVGPDPNYQDGDVLTAINRRRCRCVHAQHICHPRVAARNRDGLILPDHHARDFCEHTHQYRLERVSRSEVMRINLLTLEEEILSAKPNDRGEAIDVEMYFDRRRKHAHATLFGTTGQEIAYGGAVNFTNANLDRVWQAIEHKTSEREANYQDWPAGQVELRAHLLLRVDDFTDSEAGELESPLVGRNGGTVAKRKHSLEWRGLLTPKQLADVEDRSRMADLRESLGTVARGGRTSTKRERT